MEESITVQRKPYEKPKVIYAAALEAYAASCDKANALEETCYLGGDGTIKS